MCAFLMTSRSTISPSRDRYMRRGSMDWDAGFEFDCALVGSDFCEFASKSAIPASMALVTSGRAGAPSGVENLIPLYSGGLCEAVKLIAPDVFSVRTAYEIAGVGAA